MSSSHDSSITRQVLDFRRTVEDFRTDCLREIIGDPRVSDICEIGRVMVFLWLVALGEAYELPRLLDRTIGERWVLRNEKESNMGERGVFGLFAGGQGAGLGLTNFSVSSTTSSRSGVNGGLKGWIAESSGVVTAWPTKSGSSGIEGRGKFREEGLSGANMSHTPDCLLLCGRGGGGIIRRCDCSSATSSMEVRGEREDILGGGAVADWVWRCSRGLMPGLEKLSTDRVARITLR